MGEFDIKEAAQYDAKVAYLKVLDYVSQGLWELKLEDFTPESGEYIGEFWKTFFEECE